MAGGSDTAQWIGAESAAANGRAIPRSRSTGSGNGKSAPEFGAIGTFVRSSRITPGSTRSADGAVRYRHPRRRVNAGRSPGRRGWPRHSRRRGWPRHGWRRRWCDPAAAERGRAHHRSRSRSGWHSGGWRSHRNASGPSRRWALLTGAAGMPGPVAGSGFDDDRNLDRPDRVILEPASDGR